MHITITYCDRCGYRANAVGLAAEIKNAHGLATELRLGEDGIFDVSVDGELVFSKYEAGRFPEPGEILDEIADRKRRSDAN